MIPARSPDAASARILVSGLQRRMVEEMRHVGGAFGDTPTFVETEWMRDEGRHGGGVRWSIGDSAVFDRAAINVSQVHYDDEPEKSLASATALSTIIHPANPHAPSVHLHISWTQMRGGTGYWRMMADLNPSIEASTDKTGFEDALRRVAPEHCAHAFAQGDKYFWIPALDRHRGVAHFYLEGHDSGGFMDDLALARAVADTTIDKYADLVAASMRAHPEPTADDRAQQLAYHTLYLFQVLTLDRGTTSGLLVHDQNDLGILGSLPSHVDCKLLASWAARVQPPQDTLVRALVGVMSGGTRCLVDDATKRAFAAEIRGFYRDHPEALAMQAAGDVIPPTVANHR